MSWTLSKTFSFEAAHRLEHHRGKCHREHGHSYRFDLVVRGSVLRDAGSRYAMIEDFDALSDVGKVVCKLLDHQRLNDVMGTDSPTAEVIAWWIFDVAVRLGLPVQAVNVYETANTCVKFCGPEDDLERWAKPWDGLVDGVKIGRVL